jgi:hypothetical protein
MDRVWEEQLFTRAALLSQKLATPFADSVKPFLTRSLAIKNEQTSLWGTETETQAKIVACNFELDELAHDVSDAKIRDLRNKNIGWRDREARESNEYRLYFPQTLSSLVRLAAESQAEEMNRWVILIEKEPSAEMLEILPRLKKAIEDTQAAVKARNEASSGTALHRVRTIEAFIAEVNTFRTRLYASLLTVSQDNRIPKNWADIFFRPTQVSTLTDENLTGMQKALLVILNTKVVKPTDEQIKKIVTVKDTQLLEQLIIKAGPAVTVDEVVKGID